MYHIVGRMESTQKTKQKRNWIWHQHFLTLLQIATLTELYKAKTKLDKARLAFWYIYILLFKKFVSHFVETITKETEHSPATHRTAQHTPEWCVNQVKDESSSFTLSSASCILLIHALLSLCSFMLQLQFEDRKTMIVSKTGMELKWIV